MVPRFQCMHCNEPLFLIGYNDAFEELYECAKCGRKFVTETQLKELSAIPAWKPKLPNKKKEIEELMVEGYKTMADENRREVNECLSAQSESALRNDV